MKIIDTHTHLNAEQFKSDLDQVILKSQRAGVFKVFNNADSLESFFSIMDLRSKYPGFCEAVLGIHPEFALQDDEYFKSAFDFIKKNRAKIKAIGEIGLDYHYSKDLNLKNRQKQIFIEQIRLAKTLDLPIVIHSRDADFDTLNIIKEELPPIIDLHCFSGSYEIYREYIKMPIKTFFGIGGVVTFKNAKVIKEIVEKGDIKTFLTETDAPYLTPTPFRGERNDPSYLPYVIKTISELKKLDIDETSKILLNNGEEFYGIDQD